MFWRRRVIIRLISREWVFNCSCHKPFSSAHSIHNWSSWIASVPMNLSLFLFKVLKPSIQRIRLKYNKFSFWWIWYLLSKKEEIFFNSACVLRQLFTPRKRVFARAHLHTPVPCGPFCLFSFCSAALTLSSALPFFTRLVISYRHLFFSSMLAFGANLKRLIIYGQLCLLLASFASIYWQVHGEFLSN